MCRVAILWPRGDKFILRIRAHHRQESRVHIETLVILRRHDGDNITDAKSMAAKKFGLKTRSIDDAWLECRRQYFLAKDDGDDFAEGLRPLRGRQKQSKGE